MSMTAVDVPALVQEPPPPPGVRHLRDLLDRMFAVEWSDRDEYERLLAEAVASAPRGV